METLPEEILLEIGLYLNLKDILNCSQVNRFWRNGFNLNKIWSIFCQRHFAIQIEGTAIIKTEPNRVSPSFKLPKIHKNSRLTDLCPWRVRYMQEIHVTRNWKMGRFQIEILINEENSEDLKRMEKDDLLCDDRNLVVYFFKKRLFRVWELSPNLIEKLPIQCSLNDQYVNYYKLYKGTFIFVQDNLLHVFTREPTGELTLKFRLLIPKDTKDSVKLPSTTDLTMWYEKEQRGDSLVNYKCFDNNCTYFIAAIQNNINKVQFHIFNIEQGIKYKKEEISMGNNIIDSDSSITVRNNSFFIKIRVKNPDDKVYKIFSYDLTKKSFTPLQLTLVNRRYVLFTDTFIVSLSDSADRLHLWNINDGSFVYEILSDPQFSPSYKARMQSCYPNWVLAENLSYGKLQVVNLEKRELVGCIFLNNQIYTTEFLPPNMVFVRLWKWDEFTELWDIERKCKVQVYKYPADCVINSSRTKMIVLDRSGKLFVLHFW